MLPGFARVLIRLLHFLPANPWQEACLLCGSGQSVQESAFSFTCHPPQGEEVATCSALSIFSLRGTFDSNQLPMLGVHEKPAPTTVGRASEGLRSNHQAGFNAWSTAEPYVPS